MGKKIIIKGADFSANGFKQIISGSLSAANGALSILSNSDTYGEVGSNVRNNRGYTTTAIFIPKGAIFTLKGLKPGSDTGLRVDGCYYSSSETSNSTVVGDLHGGTTDSSDLFLLNADGSSDGVTFTNNYGDYWFKFAFAKGSGKSDNFTAGNYNLSYEYIV